jgi:hypothetical protein
VGIGRALISTGARAGSSRGSGFNGDPGSAGGEYLGSGRRGGGWNSGAVMVLAHDGHGPLTPDFDDGTVSLIPQNGQKKWIKSSAMGLSGR